MGMQGKERWEVDSEGWRDNCVCVCVFAMRTRIEDNSAAYIIRMSSALLNEVQTAAAFPSLLLQLLHTHTRARTKIKCIYADANIYS